MSKHSYKISRSEWWSYKQIIFNIQFIIFSHQNLLLWWTESHMRWRTRPTVWGLCPVHAGSPEAQPPPKDRRCRTRRHSSGSRRPRWAGRKTGTRWSQSGTGWTGRSFWCACRLSWNSVSRIPPRWSRPSRRLLCVSMRLRWAPMGLWRRVVSVWGLFLWISFDIDIDNI